MSTAWHWIAGGVLLLLLVVAGYWYQAYHPGAGVSAKNASAQPSAIGSNLTTSPQDISSSALDQDALAVDAQLQGLSTDLLNAVQTVKEISTTTGLPVPTLRLSSLGQFSTTSAATSTLSASSVAPATLATSTGTVAAPASATIATTFSASAPATSASAAPASALTPAPTPLAAAARDAARVRPLGMAYSTASTTQALGEMLGALLDRTGVVKDPVSAAEDAADRAAAAQTTALSLLSQRVGGVQQLSEETKTELQQEIATQSSALEDLRNKAFSEIATAPLKIDVKTFADTLRLYVLTIPKLALIAAADRVATLSDDMQTVGAKYQAVIDAALSKGHNVSSAQRTLLDYQAKITDAQSVATLTQTSLANIPFGTTTPATFAAALTTLQTAQDKLTQSQQSLQQARQDLITLRQFLANTEDPPR